MISAFGVEHSDISKACNCLAAVSRAGRMGKGTGPAISMAKNHGHSAEEVTSALKQGTAIHPKTKGRL